MGTKVLIATHMRILVKMKRRLKHMMDVSDKYFLTDLMDTIHLLGKATSELAPPVEQFSVGSASSCSSFLSLDLSTSTSYLSLSSPSVSYTSSSSSSSSSGPSRPKLRPFRSFVDQLVVLARPTRSRASDLIVELIVVPDFNLVLVADANKKSFFSPKKKKKKKKKK